MAVLALFVIAVLCSLEIQGSKVTPVFVQTGHDVKLDVPEADVPKTFTVFIWRFETNDVIVSFKSAVDLDVKKAYTGRVETSEKKYSVKLKNVQKADSGLYTAKLTADKEEELVQYNVTVQDPVSPVDLEVIPNNSSSLCNLTVTCKTKDSHISNTISCYNTNCSLEEDTRPKPSISSPSPVVYLQNDYIICNHSNQVSSEQAKKELKLYCPRKSASSTAVMVVAPTVLILAIIAFILFK